MSTYRYCILLFALLLTACAGHKAAPPSLGRYERKPIHEVTPAQLSQDNRLIDALTLQETGRLDEALAVYASLTTDEPTCAAAWYGQSQLLLQRRWTDSALHCARRAVALHGDNVWYLMVLAQCQELTGDIQGAVATLNRVEAQKGITEPLSLHKQQLWEAAGRPDKALKEIEALANAMPQEIHYQAVLAEQNMQHKNYKKAKMYYDRILQADPGNEYIHIQLAEYYKQTGHRAEADSEMVRSFAHPRLDSRTKMQLLTSFYTPEEFYSTDNPICLRLLEGVVAQSNDPAEFADYYGDMLMHHGRYDEAATQLALSLQLDSTRFAVWEALLICLTEVPAREEEMVGYARRAARLFPMHTLPHYIEGFYLMRHERYAEALATLEQAAKWGFNKGYLEAETTGLLAECYYRQGQYDKAWKSFERYIALRPDDMGTLNNYAYYLSEQGIELQKAEQMSRRTIEAEPNNANSLDTYAWILHLLGRDKEALPYMEKAVRLNPSSATLQQHLREIKK